MAYERGRDKRRLRYALVAGGLAGVAALAPLQPTFAAKSKPFVPGNATAISQTIALAPRTGGLSATVVLGTTIAQYRDSLAQASSQAVNLGVIGTTLTVQCDKSPPALKASQLPQPLVAESTRGNSHATKNTAGQGSSGVIAVVGHEEVSATTVPAALASYDGSALVLPGLIDASGLHSDGASKLIPDTARVANATSQVGQLKLLNGAIVLSGMKWSASQRSGTHSGMHSSFSLGGISLAGTPLPVDKASIDSSVASINKVLAPTGLHITLPKRQLQAGILTETPLTIGIDNSKLGGQVINPVLGGLNPITNPLRTALDGMSCQFGKLFTVFDLAAAALDGTGGFDLNLGGASANTDGRTYANPFGNGQLGGGHQLGNTSGPTTSPGGGGTPSGGSSTGGNVSVPPLNTGSQQVPPDNTAPVLSGSKVVSQSCSTTSPANRPSCSQGQGVMVGLIAIGAVASIAGADYLVMRRKRRLPAVAL